MPRLLMYSQSIHRTIKLLERALLESRSIEAQITHMESTPEKKVRVATIMRDILEPTAKQLSIQVLGYKARAKGMVD